MDNAPSFLPGFIGAISAAIALPLILRTTRPNAEVIAGRQVLRYGRSIRAMMGFFWVFWLGLIALGIFVPKREPHDGLLAASLIVGFFLLLLPMHLEFFVVQVSFDENGIQTRSPWRRSRSIPWSDVTAVGFSQAAQWYSIQTKGHGRVRLHLYLSGVPALLKELDRRGVPIAPGPKHF